ncbi:MAG: pyridoxamine 5'-phosphate oxidase family protein [Propionibacteriaceae bacterium]|jgi:nitroimidazol reductase NimA-like FMN-containing flavoprotein (pyridoxamine 5'-phosphate oxidase superfamily)|nr:pyridoxamine 5'-phosphate oxidase family protein [Propionibacteriaceae bacterium]
MTENASPVTFLSDEKAWDLLAGERLGRLAVQSENGIDIFPINYVVDGESIVFRTADGTKLASVKNHSHVTFEIDSWTEEDGISVVARGHASPVTSEAEIAQIEALRLKPWVPTYKTFFVRITINQLQARRFTFGRDPIPAYRY